MAIWKIAPGPNASEWEWMRDGQFIANNWLNKVDLRTLASKKAVLQALKRADEGSSGSASSITAFMTVSRGDTVVANDGLSRVVGVGKVRSGYLPPAHPHNPNKVDPECRHAYRVDWIITSSVDLHARVFNQPTVQKLTVEQIAKIRRAYLKAYPETKAPLNDLLGNPSRESNESLIDAIADEEPTEPYKGTRIDHRVFVLRQIARRRNQRFRAKLRNRYGDQCMVTGCRIPSILEAAHIDPYQGDETDHLDNGLLLRADIHTLIDLDLIGIDPKSLRIELHPSVASDKNYQHLSGATLKCSGKHRPSPQPLRRRYKRFQEHESEPI